MSKTVLSSDLRSGLHAVATPVVEEKGRVIFRAGQPVRGAFLVRSGRVKMSLDHSPTYPPRSVGAGSMIGLPATFSGEPYSLTAKAECGCRLDFIPRARLLQHLRSHPKAGFQIVRMLSEEIFLMRKAATVKPAKALSRATRKRPLARKLKKATARRYCEK